MFAMDDTPRLRMTACGQRFAPRALESHYWHYQTAMSSFKFLLLDHSPPAPQASGLRFQILYSERNTQHATRSKKATYPVPERVSMLTLISISVLVAITAVSGFWLQASSLNPPLIDHRQPSEYTEVADSHLPSTLGSRLSTITTPRPSTPERTP